MPVHGAVVSVLPVDADEPPFGQTHTLSDGTFQMVTHGGREVTVKIDHPEYLPVMRRELVFNHDARHFGDVVLTPQDQPAAAIDLVVLASSSTPVVATSSSVEDGRGTRQVKVLFMPGTEAEIVVDPLDPTPGTPFAPSEDVDFSITEYTVGAEGPAAMPGPLPPTSAYTYATELSFAGVSSDEHVRFSNTTYTDPVVIYVDAGEFLEFEPGFTMPLGWLNHLTGGWVAAPSGQVIEITGSTSCGGGTCATLDGDDGLTLDTLELQTLDAEFETGDVVWRLPVKHLSTYDANCGPWPPAGASHASNAPGTNSPGDGPTNCPGSEVECESQVLGESVPLVGTPLSLHYRSDRVEGRTDKVDILLDYEHEDLLSADVSLYVAGTFQFADYAAASFSAASPLTHTFTWDQRDFLGRLVQGAQKAVVEVGLTYTGEYADGGTFAGPPMSGGSAVGTNVRLTRRWIIDLGHFVAEPLELGGWTIGQHHFYDPNAKRIYYGDGRRQTADARSGLEVRSVLGDSGGSGCPLDDSTDPLALGIRSTAALTSGPDGSLYVADGSGACWGIRHLKPDGEHVLLWDEAGDSEHEIGGLARGPDGSFYMSRMHSASRRVERLRPGESTPDLFAGDGTACSPTTSLCGDGDAAVAASLTKPEELAVAPDGSVYIADNGAARIRRVDPNGNISTVAGNGTISGCTVPLGSTCPGDEGDLATEVGLGSVRHMTLMQDGTIVFEAGGGGRILAVTPEGRIWKVSGFGEELYSEVNDHEGRPFNVLGTLSNVRGLATSPDGSLLVALHDRVLHVTPPIAVPVGDYNGSYSTLAGGYASQSCGTFPSCGDGFPPTAAKFGLDSSARSAIAAGPDGRIFLAEGTEVIFALQPLLPGFGASWQIPSKDATELYTFGASGRHLNTLDARTGEQMLGFSYDDGLLTSVTDMNGRVTSVKRDGSTIEINDPDRP